MAAERGSHSRSANQASPYQQDPRQNNVQGRQAAGQNAGQPTARQREAYERAYRQYVQGQNDAGQSRGQQAPYQGQTAQQAYQRKATQQAYQQRAQAGAYRQVPSYAPYGQPPVRSFEVSRKKKGHPARNILIVLLLIIVIVGGVGGFTGYTLHNSAKTVRSDASAVMADISDLKTKVLSDDPSQASAVAADIAKRASNMKSETSGWEWAVASCVPVYGEDFAKVREFSDVLDDLAQNAVIPLIGEVSQLSLKNLFVDGGINVELAQRLVTAVDQAAPVIERCSEAVENMGDAKLDQVNGLLQKAKDQLRSLSTAAQFVDGIAPTFADMIGADGSPRTYLICVQQPAEVRSTGGLIGSVGSITIDNGRFSLNDFRTVGDIYPETHNNLFQISDEEAAAFGSNASWVPSTTNYIPDWPRVSQIISYYWEMKGYGGVNGVVGMDPIFLQHILALTGPVTTESGITVDGTNAAQFIGHDAYYIEGDEVQNAVFTEIGSAVFNQLFGNIGGVPLTALASQVNDDFDTRHLQIYMVNEAEEQAMVTLGADASLPTDPTEPVVGIYANDDSWSKLCWYLKISTEVGEGVKNGDGTTTYHVTARFSNMISDESELSSSMVAHNAKEARSDGDMMQWLILSAPAGGSISNISQEGYFTNDMVEKSWKGIQLFTGHVQFMPGESVALSFDVTVSAEASEPLKVVKSPTYQEIAGW